MHILITLIVGLVVGALARVLVPGKDPGGVVITMLLGVAGAFIAGLMGRVFSWYAPGEAAGIIASIIGSIVLLVLYRAVVARRAVW